MVCPPILYLGGILYGMPTICKKDTCRNNAVYGYCFGKPLFCLHHREPDSKNVKNMCVSLKEPQPSSKSCSQCSCKTILPRFKGFCKRCYVKTFPSDPLSLQTVYKCKDDVIQKFIDSRFDGFLHQQGSSQIQIGDDVLQIVYDNENQNQNQNQNIVIKFNPNKYATCGGSYENPMLYTRLPHLEKEIARQFERIMNGLERENSEMFS